MAPYRISITKQATWRGQQEQFSNIYHYDLLGSSLSQADWQAIADQIMGIEQPVHSSSVSFVSWIASGPTNQGALAHKVVAEGTLSGVGTMGGTLIYPEMAVVVSWYVGRSPTTNRKRFLRKYIHSIALPTGTATDALTGRATLGTAGKAPFVTYANAIKNLTVSAANVPICTWQGDHLPLNTTGKVLDYLHIRQLRQ